MKPLITYMSDKTRKLLIEKYNGWFVPPLANQNQFPRWGNPNSSWKDDSEKGGGKNNYAVPIKCGWCDNITFSWSNTNKRALMNLDEHDTCGTICSFCGRTIQLYYKNWSYRAEFSNGGIIMQFLDGSTSIEGSIEEFPIIEWGIPNLDYIYRMVDSYKKIKSPYWH
jgi:hypothetical protein